MKYRWLKQPVTKESIEKLLGKKIKQFTVGQLDNGEGELVSGIEIEVETELTPKQLMGLVAFFPKSKREGL